MATIAEMIVKLLADTSNFNANMAEAATTVKASQDAMATSVASSMNAFRNFDAIQKDSIQTSADLAEAQAALTAARESGAFTSEEMAAKEALVAQAMKNVGQETQEASGVLNLFTNNSRTMYSTSAFITDAMTGQFSRMRREVAALGNETGLMASAFRFAVSPAGLLTGALAAVAAMALRAHIDIRELQGDLFLTGQGAALPAKALDDLAARIRATGASSGRANDALKAIAASGKFTADEFVNVGSAAAAMADMSGDKIEQVVGQLARFQEDPVRAIKSLTAAQEFLTAGQAREIARLEETKGKAAAAAETFRLLAQAMTQRDKAFNDSGNGLDKWASKQGNFWSSLFHGGLGDSPVNKQLGDISQRLNEIRTQTGAWYEKAADGTVKLANAGRLTALGQHEVNGLLADYNKLSQEATRNQDALTSSAQKQEASKKAIDDALGKTSTGASGIGALEQQFQEQEAAAHASYDQMKQDAADFWNAQATNSKNSAAVQAKAWQKYIEIRHQLDEQGLASDNAAARKREETSLKAAEAAKRAAEARARAEQRAGDEIQQEAQKEATARRAADLAEINGARQVALARIASARQQAQTEFDSGSISAAELLQVEQQLVQRKLAEELRYYRQKLLLDQGDVAAQKADTAAIEAAKIKANQAMSANTDKFIKDDERKWKGYGQRIAGAFQNATNSMLFQGQTLRQGLASIAESIFETFLEAVVNKPLQAFIAGEGEKLAAAIGFGSQKTAADETQRAINAAADIADKTAAAARAAGLAGAQGVASFAAAPWPIDMGAPAFGAAMFAAAGAFGSVASAANGWERVPADGMMTQLHKDEMVLPKHVADPVRNMVKNGGSSGGGGTVHIHAMDSRSFRDFLSRNPRAVQMALAHAGRNGW